MRISDWSSDVCSAVLLAFKIRHRELADAARFLAEAAVFAVVAIVAHHEDVAGGHGVDAGVVGDGVAAVDRLEAFAARQRLAVALIAADGRARRIDILERGVAMIIWALRDHEIGDPFTRDGDAVEDDLAGAHLDRIAGKADHALAIGRWGKKGAV